MARIVPSATAPADIYRTFIDVVTPRPIGFISTIDKEGRPNLAPFSFFNMVSANPAICFFAPALAGRSMKKKDSLLNVEEVPEFVVNIVTEDMVPKMHQTSFNYERGVNEFEQVGLTMIPSELVRPPRVAESPVHLECRVIEIKSFGLVPGGGNMVLGEVVLVHIKDSIMEADGRILPQNLPTVGRLGGEFYSRTNADLFTLPRPK